MLSARLPAGQIAEQPTVRPQLSTATAAPRQPACLGDASACSGASAPRTATRVASPRAPEELGYKARTWERLGLQAPPRLDLQDRNRGGQRVGAGAATRSTMSSAPAGPP